MKSFLSPLIKDPTPHWRLVNARTGRVVADEISTAFDSASRRKGLLGRDSMAAGSAIVIAPTNAIHTFFMRFEIDVAFVSKDGRILKLRHRLRPWRVFGALRGFAAIELPGGALEASSCDPGDRLALESR